ncbi:hypothetical protein ACHAXA_001107 [Cyclostephanos tholiformis]|uniref:Uncharacterized protein n=1 Tax=Cyclostephanos tholiformis TaxID=382380 RepID=A0ABD3RDB4_9STRA
MSAIAFKRVESLGEPESFSNCTGIDSVNCIFNSSDTRITTDENSVESVVSPSSQYPGIQEPRTSSLPSQNPRFQLMRRSSLRSADRRCESTRSVGFSTVQTRVFEVIDERPEPALDDGENEPESWNSRDPSWSFADTLSDIEVHEASKLPVEERDDYWGFMRRKKIQDHMLRVEREKEKLMLQKERRGIRSKVLQTLSSGVKGAVYILFPIQKT